MTAGYSVRKVMDVLSALYENGVKLWVADGELHCRAPKGVMTADQLRILRDLKQQVIAVLTEQQLNVEAGVDSALPASANSVRSAPLSFQQEEYWGWLQQDGQHYGLTTFALRLHGTLNVNHLRRSVTAVVTRHSVLRTRIVTTNGVPGQVIDDPSQYDLKIVNITAATTGEVDSAAAQFVRNLSGRRVDWAVGPLFEATLLKLAECDHVLAVVVDHVITDGLSMAIFFRELWSTYETLLRGRQLSHADAPMQFSEYAIWQQGRYQDERQRTENYWRAQLAGATPAQLPVDHDIKDVAPRCAGERMVSFGKTLSAAIHDLARHERTSPSMVVLAMYVALWSDWCNQKDVIVTIMVAGRSQAAHFNVMGCFAHRVPLRVRLAGNETFTDLLALVCQQLYAANEHLDFRQSGIIARELCRGAMFNWLGDELCTAYEHLDFGGVQINAPSGAPVPSELDGRALAIEPFPGQGRSPEKLSIPCAIWMTFSYAAQGICGHIYYRADLFKAPTIERFAWNFCSLAQLIVRNPHHILSTLLARGPVASGDRIPLS